jgi:hypothetical protein
MEFDESFARYKGKKNALEKTEMTTMKMTRMVVIGIMLQEKTETTTMKKMKAVLILIILMRSSSL